MDTREQGCSDPSYKKTRHYTGSWYTPKFSAVVQGTESGVGGQSWVTKSGKKERQRGRGEGEEMKGKERRGCHGI